MSVLRVETTRRSQTAVDFQIRTLPILRIACVIFVNHLNSYKCFRTGRLMVYRTNEKLFFIRLH